MSGDVEFYEPEEKTFGQLIEPYSQPQEPVNQKCAIFSGFPYDKGTQEHGGKVGGAVASTIIRNTLKEKELYLHTKIPLYDAGDIETRKTLEEASSDLLEKQAGILKRYPNGLLINIGGSHDQTIANALALMKSYPDARIGFINLDSHFDVKSLKQDKLNSELHFKPIIEHPTFQKNNSKFVSFAAKGSTCSNDHYKYLQDKNCKIYWMEKDVRKYKVAQNSEYSTQGGQLFEKIVKQMEKQMDLIFVSIDVDCISSRYMPGVSAASVIGGLKAQEAIQIVKIAGKSTKVKMIDFSEFNPAVESTLSSRLIAEMIYFVVSEYSQNDINEQ